MGLDPRRKDVALICCLKGGKSDPDLIEQFGRRAKQNDRLHAKVIWTNAAAIVSSANASSNGLPEEEAASAGLIEAGTLISDDKELLAIKEWFDELYRKSRVIKKQDLEAARAARNKRIWKQNSKLSSDKKQSLIEAMQDGGSLEFDKQRIFFVLYRERPTSTQLAKARATVKKDKEAIANTYKMSDLQFRGLDFYFNWPTLPSSAYLIDLESYRRAWHVHGILKTFDTKRTWPVRFANGETDRLTFAQPARHAFPYSIGLKDRAVLRAAANKLWKRASGDSSGRIISLKDAAATILSLTEAQGGK
nr:hypothetical protein CIT39_32860 [Bradyrhizobium symbiodeficiens]